MDLVAVVVNGWDEDVVGLIVAELDDQLGKIGFDGRDVCCF